MKADGALQSLRLGFPVLRKGNWGTGVVAEPKLTPISRFPLWGSFRCSFRLPPSTCKSSDALLMFSFYLTETVAPPEQFQDIRGFLSRQNKAMRTFLPSRRREVLIFMRKRHRACHLTKQREERGSEDGEYFTVARYIECHKQTEHK